MRRILKAGQMKKCDSYTSDILGVPSVVLMERAALSAFISICNCGIMYEDTKTLVICGTGNNGADGLALARILHEGGYPVDYCIPFDSDKHSELFDKQLDILLKYELNPIEKDEIYDGYDIIVDAMFGIGLSRKLSTEYEYFLKRINKFKGHHVALDIPSGINADTGAVMGAAFKADITVTFGYAKHGHVLYPGKDYTGNLLIANIGITDRSLKAVNDEILSVVWEKEDVVNTLPRRAKDGNKGTFGKVLVYAGSREISGACVLSTWSAFKSGAGMVKVFTSPENAEIVKKAVPEAMVTILPAKSTDYEKLKKDIDWADVIVAGPGIGMDDSAGEMLLALLNYGREKPMVLDADALNLIAADSTRTFEGLIKRRRVPTVFTPHLAELSRLTGKTVAALKTDLSSATAQYSKSMGVITVAKDATTLITDGYHNAYVASGNNGMATAGSGDVLSGIIAALLGQSDKNSWEAVLNAVYIHGMAGTMCLEKMAEDSITARDIISNVVLSIKEIRDEQKGLKGLIK
jgi:NAD(P)H-hydrate epimerase